MITYAKEFSSKIIFLGLTPIDESKVDPISWKPYKSYKNKCIQKFNEIIKDVCTENHVNFIDILSIFKSEYKKLLKDGLHPNSEGHQKIFESVKNFLIENKII